MEILLEYLSKGILIMLTITMPCICTAAAIGLVVGILQAVTQVQEQTIAAAPKVLAVFLVILMCGVGFTRMLTNMFHEGMDLAFNVVTKNDDYVLDNGYYRYTKPFSDELHKSYSSSQTGRVKNLMENGGNAPLIQDTTKIKTYSSVKEDIPTANYVESRKINGR